MNFLPSFSLSNSGHANGLIGLANDFQVGEDNWVQIAPYGNFPHPGPRGKNGKLLKPKGCLQRFDSKSAKAIVDEFNSPLSRVGRALLGERPWYVGHHDVDPIKYPDPKSYAWVKALENRADGLWGQVEWSPEGKKLIDDKAFKFHSPYWDVVETKETTPDGRTVVMPKRLNSVAFTNQPNINVMPLANDAEVQLATAQEDPADLLISKYVTLGVIGEAEREEWLGYFNEDFQDAAWALANAGTSAGVKKAWETRRRNAAAKAAKLPVLSAKVAGKALKAGKATKSAKATTKKAVKAKAETKATPPPLPPRKPAAVRRQVLTTAFPGGEVPHLSPHVLATAHAIKLGRNPFL